MPGTRCRGRRDSGASIKHKLTPVVNSERVNIIQALTYPVLFDIWNVSCVPVSPETWDSEALAGQILHFNGG